MITGSTHEEQVHQLFAGARKNVAFARALVHDGNALTVVGDEGDLGLGGGHACDLAENAEGADDGPKSPAQS